jgi:hypothetical protein
MYEVACATAGRRSPWLLAGTLLAVLMLMTGTARATGEMMTLVEEANIEEITQWVYRNGATVAAPDCEAVCTALLEAERATMPNEAMSAELWAELNTLETATAAEEGVGLLPRLGTFARALSPYTGWIGLGATAVWGTWKIRGAIDKWLEVRFPEQPNEAEGISLAWAEAGDTEPFPTYHQRVGMPYTGFVVMSEHLGAIVGQRTSGPLGCRQPGPSSFPDGFTVVSWWWNDCWAGYEYELFPVTAYGLVAKPSTMLPHPIEDFDGQSYDAESSGLADPGQEEVEDRLADALNSGQYPLLNQWLDHMLGGTLDNPLCEPVPGATRVKIPAIMPGQTAADYEDCLDTLGLVEHERVVVPDRLAVLAQPARGVVSIDPAEGTTVDLEEHIEVAINPNSMPRAEELEDTEDCELSTPTFPVEPPANDPTPEEFSLITDSSLVASEGFVSTYGSTSMHWGATTFLGIFDGRPDYDGWGYQHIAAKHGWSRADDTATRTALDGFSRPSKNPDALEAYVFYGPEYRQAGRTCVRVVVVEYEAAEGEPEPKGIITSFGGDIARLPSYLIH